MARLQQKTNRDQNCNIKPQTYPDLDKRGINLFQFGTQGKYNLYLKLKFSLLVMGYYKEMWQKPD